MNEEACEIQHITFYQKAELVPAPKSNTLDGEKSGSLLRT